MNTEQVTRLMKKVVQDGECQIWTACKDEYGRGRTHYDGVGGITAGKAMYLAEVGPVPEGYQLYRICGRPDCVATKHTVLRKIYSRGSKTPFRLCALGHRRSLITGHWVCLVCRELHYKLRAIKGLA